MNLDSHALGWLTSCGIPANEDDFERSYSFQHPLNASRQLKRLSIQRPIGADESLLWWLLFFDSAGTCILESGKAVARKLFAAAPLSRGGGRGRVAYNATLFVAPAFRRKRFAKALYAAERDLYRRWGVREIQLRAMDDGPAVWIKHFGFQPRHPELLALPYPEWARRRGFDDTVPAEPSRYPDEYLAACPNLELFKAIG